MYSSPFLPCPLSLPRFAHLSSAGSQLTLLSGAVMVSAGFVHLLGQAVVELPVLRESSFPWAPFLCGCGFMSTLLADQYADSLSERGSGSATPASLSLRCHSGERGVLTSGHPSLIVEHEGAVVQHMAVAGAWEDAGALRQCC